MPAFGAALSDADIEAVIARRSLATAPFIRHRPTFRRHVRAARPAPLAVIAPGGHVAVRFARPVCPQTQKEAFRCALQC